MVNFPADAEFRVGESLMPFEQLARVVAQSQQMLSNLDSDGLARLTKILDVLELLCKADDEVLDTVLSILAREKQKE